MQTYVRTSVLKDSQYQSFRIKEFINYGVKYFAIFYSIIYDFLTGIKKFPFLRNLTFKFIGNIYIAKVVRIRIKITAKKK